MSAARERGCLFLSNKYPRESNQIAVILHERIRPARQANVLHHPPMIDMIFDGYRFACPLIVAAEPAIDSNIVISRHLCFYDLLGRRHIASVTCCYYTDFCALKQ